MDKITEKFLDEFCNSFELKNKDKSLKFEYFCNYCCTNKENGIIDIELDDFTTGDSAQGIDGIAIIVNNKLVTCVSDVKNQIESSRVLNVNFVLIQAKTSSSFSNNLILNFFEFSKLFFDGDGSEFSTQEMQNFIEIKKFIYDNAEYMTESNPKLSMYYVTTGIWTDDKNLVKVIERNKKELSDLNIFSKVDFFPCGTKEIQNMYRNIKNKLTTKFQFDKNIVMFSNEEEGSIGYSGVIPFREFKKIIIGEGESLKPVFDDNIRDFLGNKNQVNNEIAQTLLEKNPNSFCMFNNGITIIAEKIQITGATVILTDYQIVNGCQTSHILYTNRNLDGIDDLMIPIRLIGTNDETIRNRITKATNSQTSIKPEQLEALSDFQKNLEVFYNTFDEKDRLYYERRTGQYRTTPIQNTRIVGIPKQIKSITAMFLNNPHGVSGSYGSITKLIGDKIFNPDDNKLVYYTSSLTLYKIERLLSDGFIDKKYYKSRYHAIMLFRIYISGEKVPYFNENKMDGYCKKILDVLKDDMECQKIFKKIVDFIVSLDELDINDRKTFERKETTDLLLNKIKKLK